MLKVIELARKAAPTDAAVIVTGESAENRNLEPAGGAALKPGPYIVISVADQGVGIPPPQLNRIFDPFFSTKDRGTGLGLPVRYSVVSNHQGSIEAFSEPGKGTIFDVYLPAQPGLIPETAPAFKTQGDQRRSERVLVMDDDPAVKAVVSSGYSSQLLEGTCEAKGFQAVLRKPYTLTEVARGASYFLNNRR